MFLHGLSQKTDCAGKENAFWVFPSAVPCNYVFHVFHPWEFVFACFRICLQLYLGIGDVEQLSRQKTLHTSSKVDQQTIRIDQGYCLKHCRFVCLWRTFSIPASKKPVLKEVQNVVIICKKNAWCSFKNAMEGQVQNLHISCFCCVFISLLCTGKVLFVSQTVRTCQQWGCA